MRPCQSPFAAYAACIGQVATLAGGTMSASCSACLTRGSLASARAAYVVIPAVASAALAFGPDADKLGQVVGGRGRRGSLTAAAAATGAAASAGASSGTSTS